jgi:hypothetical protein
VTRALLASLLSHDRVNSVRPPDSLTIAALAYLALPNFIFFIGWLRWPFALIFSLLLAYSFRTAIDWQQVVWQLPYRKSVCLTIVTAALVWCAFGGAGHFVAASDRLAGARRSSRGPGLWRLANLLCDQGRCPLHPPLCDRVLPAGSAVCENVGDPGGGPRAVFVDRPGRSPFSAQPAAAAATWFAAAAPVACGRDVQRHGLARCAYLLGRMARVPGSA